jgi:hypothetical protein
MNQLVEKLKNIKGVSFVSIIYTNQQNEKQQTIFNVGVDYSKAKQKDLEYLQTLNVEELNSTLPIDILEEAKQSLINDFTKPYKAEKESPFISLEKGLKMHRETNEVYVFGMQIKKTVLEEGEYKEDTRKPLTRAKDEIRKQLRSTKYRQFKIDRAEQFKVKGDTIVFGEDIVE